MTSRLNKVFFQRDILEVAPDIIGKKLVRRWENKCQKFQISEIEIYRGKEDLACHASKGRTQRTEVMFWEGGYLYVYLIYGMYWLLNIVTGKEDVPQAILIRGVGNFKGPGNVGKALQLDRSFYGEDLQSSDRIWIEDDGLCYPYNCFSRIGIDYAGKKWKNIEWRYVLAKSRFNES